MRKHFVPSYYYRDQHQKLQRLYQGTKSVEDYHKEMEMTMIKANIVEDRETTMARFFYGLNREIADVVELQHYVELEDMVIELESEHESDDMSPLEDISDNDIEMAARGETLVVQRALSAQVVEDSSGQRKNIFHTRCHICGKVKKLCLKCEKHPWPYKLQWLNDCAEIKVRRQVMVAFTIGRFSNEILCDVRLMQASHILLGRPWQYDMKARHDGFHNRYTLSLNGRKFTLAPLTPKEVYEDQIRMTKHFE
ncbi:hypothetical protein Cni_G02986 [Canna indica]|uniref:Retrotransposon gag domain-containing protein n=1 Tax=Canna indica TaxID=4628 RepID=A0AAQ3Q2X9_9LILI|nr:hypothetical protein Cni_G02986 [Canna indica]